MKIVAYQQNGMVRVGVVDPEGLIISAAEADPALPATLRDILSLADGLDRLRRAVAGRKGTIPLDQAVLKPFLGRPNAMWALALNFRTHIEETGLTTSRDHPHLFLRTEKAFEHVAGYTCLNEGSVREFQIHNRQFGLGKNFEASGSYGPWLMTPDEFGDPARQRVSTRVNGVTRQDAPLDDMLFGVAQVISYLSAGYRLRPGDLIAMGTPGALKPSPTDTEGRDLTQQYGPFKTPGLVHMKPGDLVEVEITGLGVLANPVSPDLPAAYSAA
jgi:2-keto-4-pentenoate hydratase/2-oxohepta-3-ene-1,7-dioic acid hydratase in catechol pathway